MSTQPGASPTDANHQRIPRLATAGHTLMRLLWIAVTLLTVSLFAASLPDYATQMHTVCTAPPCANGQLQASQALALARLGISLDTYAASFVAFNIISSACWLFVAVLLFWRGSRDRMTLFTAFTL